VEKNYKGKRKQTRVPQADGQKNTITRKAAQLKKKKVLGEPKKLTKKTPDVWRGGSKGKEVGQNHNGQGTLKGVRMKPAPQEKKEAKGKKIDGGGEKSGYRRS